MGLDKPNAQSKEHLLHRAHARAQSTEQKAQEKLHRAPSTCCTEHIAPAISVVIVVLALVFVLVVVSVIVVVNMYIQ